MAEAAAKSDSHEQCSVAVRYSMLGWVGQFRHPPGMRFGLGCKVVIKTERGIEMGTCVAWSCPHCPGGLCVSAEQARRYVEASGQEYLRPDAGEVLRIATPEDLAEERRINEQTAEKLRFCDQQAAKRGLKMRLVACEHLFGGERIIFYFTADGRVDFRQLVRDLARRYRTRIEMRQIGARDEARIVADYEICGRECCCKNFLKVLRPVNMKMAKLQKATLDPTKVSGRCGRLRCCLRFEHSTYEELDARLPKVGQVVKTSKGTGTVCDRHILTQLLVLDMGEGKRQVVPVEEVLEVEGEPVAEALSVEADDAVEAAPLRGADFDDEESTLLRPESVLPDESGGNGGSGGDGRNGGRGGRRRGRRSRRARRQGPNMQ